MSWRAGLLLLTVALYVLQGAALVRAGRQGRVRTLGYFAIVVTVLGFFAFSLWHWGSLVPSREFGLLMVEGPAAGRALGLLVVVVTLAPGLLWLAARSGQHLVWPSVVMLVVAVLAVSRILPLNPSDEPVFRVYAYELWWPPLAAGLAFVCVDSVLALIPVNSVIGRGWVAAATIAGLSLWVIGHEQFADLSAQGALSSHPLWMVGFLILFPLNLMLATRIAMRSLLRRPLPSVRWKPGAADVILALLGLISGLLWLGERRLVPDWASLGGIRALLAAVLGTSQPQILNPWFLWTASFILVGLAAGKQVYATVLVPLATWLRSPRNWRDYVAPALSCVLFVLGLAGLAYPLLSLPVSLALLVFGAIVAGETAAGAPRGGISQTVLIQTLDGLLWQRIKPARELFPPRRSRRSAAGEPADEGDAEQSTDENAVKQPAKGTGVRSGASVVLAGLRLLRNTVLVAIVIIVLLVVIAEIPNFGKTIIQPFTTPGFSDQKGRLGEEISTRLINALALLEQELRWDAVVLSPDPDRDEAGRSRSRFASVRSVVAVDAALAESGTVEIGGVKIPLGFIAGLVKGIARVPLRVRVISGSLHTDPEGFVLFASATSGETWRTHFVVKGKATSAEDLTPDAVDQLTDKLAFRILSTDSSLAAAGITSSWEALRDFRNGLKQWQLFERTGDYDLLALAINGFRQATFKDPRFALAYYRLGRALTADGQPRAAADSFIVSLRVNPSFVPGYLALASTLYGFDSHYFQAGAAVSPPESDDSGRLMQRMEALNRWRAVLRLSPNVLSPIDRGSAYNGLCDFVRDTDIHTTSARHIYRADLARTYLAYYYCARALSSYSRAGADFRTGQGIRSSQASVLHSLGAILETRKQGRLIEVPAREWHCFEFTFLPRTPSGAARQLLLLGAQPIQNRLLRTSPYIRAARTYYGRAQRLLPDDEAIRCSAASAAYLMGDPRPMQELALSTAAHFRLGESFLRSAKKGGSYYALAVGEYADAVQLDRNSIRALKGYADAFWQWSFAHQGGLLPGPPRRAIAVSAKAYGAQAVRLASDRLVLADAAGLTSTFGVVLLAHGEWVGSVAALTDAVTYAPRHAQFDEIRWNLALALLCASTKPEAYRSLGGPERLREKAATLLEEIRRSEQSREFRPFTDQGPLLKETYLVNHRVCMRGNEK